MQLFSSVLGLVSDKAVNVVRLLLLQALGASLPYNFEGPRSGLLHSYDFVVVGSGPGGSAVAARLSEVAGVRVLLLEAGGHASPETAVPGLIPLGVFNSNNSWGFQTVSKTNQQMGLVDNSLLYYQGRGMGGSSSINGMVFARGSPLDYDNWARLGNKGWDFASVLPYFRKLEDFKGYETPNTDIFRGRRGPVSVEKKRYSTRSMRTLLEATMELGYRPIADDSQPRQTGFAPHHVSSRDGLRASASENYLRPIIGRSSLHIQTRALVTKILFDSRKRAVGVEFELDGNVRRVAATKEVVVCAGAINTPKLLMLSGVGPKRHLQDMQVPLVAPLEGVGQHLQDHFGINYLPFVTDPGQSVGPGDVFNFTALKEFAQNRTGIFAVPTGLEANGYFSFEEGSTIWPDVFLSLTSLAPVDGGIITGSMLGFRREYSDALYKPILVAPSAISYNIATARPRSSGWVKLASRDPKDKPVIDFNFLSDPRDMRLIVKGIRFVFALLDTMAMKSVGAKYKSLPVPGCDQYEHLSDGYWECMVLASVQSQWHACGTAKMAPLNDPMGVVDARLRLRGVTGVRVVDSSIMPQIVIPNLQATVYMIGEKGADMIKQDWGYPTDPL